MEKLLSYTQMTAGSVPAGPTIKQLLGPVIANYFVNELLPLQKKYKTFPEIDDILCTIAHVELNLISRQSARIVLEELFKNAS